MMYQKLKDLQLQARKDKSALASLYSTILGDLQKAEKNGDAITDAKVIAVLKSFVASATEMTKYGSSSAAVELDALNKLIPSQMSENDIEAAIIESGAKTLGDAMKSLKEKFAGKYDGKLAQMVAKRLFSVV